jgi:hypothetical protein
VVGEALALLYDQPVASLLGAAQAAGHTEPAPPMAA